MKISTKELLTYSFIKPLNDVSPKQIIQFYTCDVLTWILSHVKENNVCLLTMLTQMNVIAVAKKTNINCIIFCEVMPSSDVIKKATEENIALYFSEKCSSYTLQNILGVKDE